MGGSDGASVPRSSAALLAGAKLLGHNLQIGKVALGSRSDPQSDASFPRLELQIVDDEAGLLRSMHVEPRLAAFHFRWLHQSEARHGSIPVGTIR